VSAYREADTKEAGARRRRWPDALKRQLVAETLEPGASVSMVARRHDVNANQLFKWRRELASMPRTDTKLVPVAVVQEPAADPALPSAAPVRVVPTPARIEIAVAGGVRVRIEGAADPAAVTAAVAAVMKARGRR
jgi:transposase